MSSISRLPSPIGRRAALLGATLGLASAGIRPARAATPLKVSYIPILSMAQLYVIIGEGWATQAGLDLQLTRFSSGPAMVQSLASGNFDFAYVGIGPAMVARAAGVDIEVVASCGAGSGGLIGVGPFVQTIGAAANAAAAFATFHKEQGRPVRVATLPKGSVPDTVLQYWLNEVAHIPPADVQVLGVGEDKVQQVLLSGAADVASALEPTPTIVLERVPTARIVVTSQQMFPNAPGSVLAVREATIKANRAAVQTMVELHIRATKLIDSDPARAAKSTAQILGPGLVSEETLAKSFGKQKIGSADPRDIMASTDTMAKFQSGLGSLAHVVPAAEFFDPSFYDAAIKKG